MAPASFHENTSSPVCVMDASGRLGSALVERLLQRGYTVHAAIQNHGELKIGSAISSDMKKKLKIFLADPFDFHGIIDALRGCSGLFYTYEPPRDQSVYDEYTAEEEVRAAHNVLEACAQTETIDKVVFTSSVTAVIWRSNDLNSVANSDVDERSWSDISFCRKYKLWHGLSKTLAEKTAWALAMDRGMSMVSINAGFLTTPDNLSIKNPYLKGAAEMYEDGVFVTVDLSVMADAHVCVFEDVSSYGRYICFNNVINRPEDASKLTKMLTPSLPQSYSEDMRIIPQRISNKKLNKLIAEFGSKHQLD